MLTREPQAGNDDEFAHAPKPMRRDRFATETFEAKSFWKALASFLAGFVIVAAALHFLVNDPAKLYTPDLTEKLITLDQVGRDATTVALGSSITHNGFDPRAFDKVMAGTGIASRSMNMGLSAGSQIEMFFAGRYWSKQLPSNQKPCMVLLEVNSPSVFTLKWMTHPREINEYDLDEELMSLKVQLPKESKARRLHYRIAGLISLASHYINLGMLSNRIFRPPLNEEDALSETSNDHRGMETPTPNVASRAFVAAKFANQPTVRVPGESLLTRTQTELLEALHASLPKDQPIRFVDFVMPSLEDLYVKRSYPDSIKTSFGDVPLINLAQPERYPQFYKPDLWYDDQHILGPGATMVTTELARSLLQWYARHLDSLQPNSFCGAANAVR